MKTVFVFVSVCCVTAFGESFMTCEQFEREGYVGKFAPFRCKRFVDPTRECIYHGHKCDSLVDCDDGSDEDPAECKEQHAEYCKEGAEGKPFSFGRCRSGMCYEECRRCDGTMDCFDGSDEQDCVKVVPGNCSHLHTPMKGVILD